MELIKSADDKITAKFPNLKKINTNIIASTTSVVPKKPSTKAAKKELVRSQPIFDSKVYYLHNKIYCLFGSISVTSKRINTIKILF